MIFILINSGRYYSLLSVVVHLTYAIITECKLLDLFKWLLGQ